MHLRSVLFAIAAGWNDSGQASVWCRSGAGVMSLKSQRSLHLAVARAGSGADSPVVKKGIANYAVKGSVEMRKSPLTVFIRAAHGIRRRLPRLLATAAQDRQSQAAEPARHHAVRPSVRSDRSLLLLRQELCCRDLRWPMLEIYTVRANFHGCGCASTLNCLNLKSRSHEVYCLEGIG